MNIQLQYLESCHDDLTLSIPEIGLNQIADTYYFAIDEEREFLGDHKIVFGVKLLIAGWKTSIINLKKGGIAFLPFDFSDQYLGCLKVSAIFDATLQIEYGFTQQYSGCDTYPSQSLNLDINEGSFLIDRPALIVTKSEFLKDIDRFLVS